MTKDLKETALDLLEGNWGAAVGATLIIFILIQVVSIIINWGFSNIYDWGEIGDFISFLIISPLTLGGYYLTLNIIRQEQPHIRNIFIWCVDMRKLLKSFLVYLLLYFYLILWTLLLIVPGIIKFISYTMTYFILNDYPDCTMNQAITKSRHMMNGHKIAYMILCLSFIGWFMLSLVTLGIGFLWLIPYFHTTKAVFYEEIAMKDSIAKLKKYD
ncbi:DUF975 family protein [Bacillus thuringiensis]|uniref:DUF975 family protein n=1 Tax=Bacillus cereus group TaxID=86661 RepID=UPI003303A9EE|nr:DUF975 family protein [Bacillus cereus]HDR8117321.1 DUF975 family protein [Bacillus cereus]